MSKTRIRIAAVLIFTALSIPCAPCVAVQQAPATDASLADLKRRVNQLKTRIREDRQALDETRRAVEAAERRIHLLTRERAALDERLKGVQAEIEELEDARRERERELPGLREEIARVLSVQYRLKRASKLRLVLDETEPRLIQRVLVYYEYLVEAEARRLEALTRTLEETGRLRRALAERRRRMVDANRQLRDKRAAIVEQTAIRKAKIEAFEESIARNRDLLERTEAERRQLQRLLAGLEGIARESAAEPITLAGLAARKGSLPLPIRGKVAVRFAQKDDFSGVPSTGVVIRGSMGAEIRSIADGRVVYADWFRGFGLLLVLDHGAGFMSLYGYNSELLYDVGGTVPGGAPVARAGNTGGRERAGLYFEIRRDGEPVDPLLWCRG